MGQVPTYLVIGNGRLAKHITHYMSLLSLPYAQWSRHKPHQNNLKALSKTAENILIAISDDAIESFIQNHAFLQQKKCLHFSGRLRTELAISVHPLTTFNQKMMTLDQYVSIPFILDKKSPSFESLLPGFPNPHYKIEPEQKDFYHSLCVMSSNFTSILWQKFYHSLENDLGIPKEAGHVLMKHTFSNITDNVSTSLTGPLMRGDHKTIKENIKALNNDPFQEVYKSFVRAYTNSKELCHEHH